MQTVTAPIDYRALYEKAQSEISFLKHELAQLKKIIYGSKHERFVPTQSTHPGQLSLDIQAEAIAAVKITDVKKIEYTKVTQSITDNNKIHPGRNPLPEHLERREQIIEPAQDTAGLKKIGEEITEELEYEPGKLFVNKYVRFKYAKPGNEGVLIAPVKERPLPKAIVGAGLLARIIIDKYVDHLPLYRQMERFKRDNVNIAHSTVGDWITNGSALLLPLYDCHKKRVLQCDYLQADETPLKVLDKDKKGTTHKGYYWVYHSSIERMVLFDYQQGRGREGPETMLKNFKGCLQADGYVAYDFFKDKEEVTVLHCMAHARRYFFDALQNDKDRAEYALKLFGLLYATETKAKEEQLNADEILCLRQAEALPVLQTLGKWMKEEYVKTLPKSAIAQALAYSIERWEELMIYATDGKLNIDNNPVENSIRPIAIGRKNYLFAGSHEAAQRSAMLYSLLGTCKLNGINPFVWLKNVLQRIATHPINKIEELLPQNWKPVTNG